MLNIFLYNVNVEYRLRPIMVLAVKVEFSEYFWGNFPAGEPGEASRIVRVV